MIKFERVSSNPTATIPIRSTSGSAGYDFVSTQNCMLRPGETVKINTGIKCMMPEDTVLLIVPRSSSGIKRHLRLANTVGVIDSDYYNNEDNEGEIIIALNNYGDNDVHILEGERIAQGIILKYCVTDDVVETKRTGGIGSTGVIYRAKS